MQTVDSNGASARPQRPRAQVSAPRVTTIAALIVMVGVLAQAALAGGFLAGYGGLRMIHMVVGMVLVVSAIVLVVVGLFPRRERWPRLAVRIGVLFALLLTGILGLMAGQGSRDLLIAHMPLAIVSMGLASRLITRSGPDDQRDRAADSL